jgi:hypothetical protein
VAVGSPTGTGALDATADVATEDAPGVTPRWRRALRAGDAGPVAVLVAVPLLLFVVPALFGHPAIGGDNAIQNFPLRVLVGNLVRGGHLPLWNPYIWSGSPLLGGLNAGAAYPLTLVFAVLAPVAAWVVNLLAVYWAAGLGMYALVRQFGARPVAALVAGLSYAFAGAMSGQIVHLGVVQGMAWAPWVVLALVRLSWSVLGTGPRRVEGDPVGRRGSPWPWVVLLAVSVGLVVLTGEPRAMAEVEVVALALGLWLAVHPYGPWTVGWRARATFVGAAVGAGIWGVALGAVQIIPGWSFISTSQRASESYQFFGAGSLKPAWTALLLVPDLFGGDGLFHQPTFFNNYNLAEVTGYLGLLPLVAAMALFVGCLGRHRDRRAADWAMFLSLGALGLVLAWGNFTPLGHLFVHIPLFGKTRLQSRNLGIVDLALAVLLGIWAEAALGPRPESAGLSGRRRWVVLLPVYAAGALLITALAVPSPLEEAFEATSVGAALGRRLTPWFLAELVVAVGVVVLVVLWSKLSPAARRWFLVSIVVLDVGLFMVSSSTGLSNGHSPVEPTTAVATAVLGSTGRFAIYDTGGPTATLSIIGQPDLNVMTGLPSVVGYGSIIDQTYGTATGTHTLDTLNTCALAEGEFTQLRLGTLLTRAISLTQAVPAGAPTPAASPATATPCPGAPKPGSANRRTFWLGQDLALTGATLARVPGVAGRGPLRLGVVGPSGTVTYPHETVRRVAGGWDVRFTRPQAAWGVVVRGPAQAVDDTSLVTTTQGTRFALDGALQDALSTTRWGLRGSWRSFVTFAARRVAPPVWTTGAAGATARQVDSGADGGAVVEVDSAHPVTVVRSETYIKGWSVEAVPAGGGPTRTLPVVPAGLVQGVHLPAGHWTLTYDYHPHGLDVGIGLSAAGGVALVAVGAVAAVRRRRRRAAAGR